MVGDGAVVCRGHEWQGIGTKLEVADVLGVQILYFGGGGVNTEGTMICERSSASVVEHCSPGLFIEYYSNHCSLCTIHTVYRIL
jgi:hypothetical protein